MLPPPDSPFPVCGKLLLGAGQGTGYTRVCREVSGPETGRHGSNAKSMRRGQETSWNTKVLGRGGGITLLASLGAQSPKTSSRGEGGEILGLESSGSCVLRHPVAKHMEAQNQTSGGDGLTSR